MNDAARYQLAAVQYPSIINKPLLTPPSMVSRAERDEAILCDIWVAQNIVESGYLKIYDHDVAIKGN